LGRVYVTGDCLDEDGEVVDGIDVLRVYCHCYSVTCRSSKVGLVK
jgi:hypothetical protein